MKKLIFIAGPCVIESEDLCLKVAEQVLSYTQQYNIEYYFKASFDKANRSASDSFRGPGLEKGLRILEKVKKEFSIPVLTDVHETYQCEPCAEVVDVLQIPAFLCRQTDLIQAAASVAKKKSIKINVKKGQFLAPWDMRNVVEKVENTVGQKKPNWLWLTERGSSFGYNNLVVDMTGLPIMKSFGVPVIFDATHSVQLPGGAAGGKVTGGRREFIEPLVRAAVAVGIDGLFLEVHPEPSVAKSDAANAFELKELPTLLKTVQNIRSAVE